MKNLAAFLFEDLAESSQTNTMPLSVMKNTHKEQIWMQLRWYVATRG